jgi:hypothetical protein
MGILNVHNLIADVVGCLDEEDQWVATITLVGLIERQDAEFVHDAAKRSGLALEIAELGLTAGVTGRIRIFDDGS